MVTNVKMGYRYQIIDNFIELSITQLSINILNVDLNAILQTTVEGTREKKLNPLMSHVHAATTSPISKANATTNVANLDFILDTLSCRLESLEDVVEELQ